LAEEHFQSESESMSARTSPSGLIAGPYHFSIQSLVVSLSDSVFMLYIYNIRHLKR